MDMTLLAFIFLDVFVCVLAVAMVIFAHRQSKSMKNVDRHLGCLGCTVKQLSDIDTSVDKCRCYIKATDGTLTKISSEQRKEGENDV